MERETEVERREGEEEAKRKNKMDFKMAVMLAPMKVPMEKKDFKTLRPERFLLLFINLIRANDYL